MTARHSPLFSLSPGQSGLGIYTTPRDAARVDLGADFGHASAAVDPELADQALDRLNPAFCELYAAEARPSCGPEQLLLD